MLKRSMNGVVLLALIGAPAALAQQDTSKLSARLDHTEPAKARPPYAWVEFCKTYPAECTLDSREPKFIVLSEKIWRLLIAVNNKVNQDIEPITDMDHWGVADRWDMAEDGKGDTEEYVNVKKRRLVDAGLPRRALLTTVVIDEENAGHAVLTVRTDRGDFILDNKRNQILSWHETPYVFVKRLSQDKVEWVWLGGAAGPAANVRQKKVIN